MYYDLDFSPLIYITFQYCIINLYTSLRILRKDYVPYLENVLEGLEP